MKQSIHESTRITCSTASLVDHIFTNLAEKISQSGVINIGISDHQLIFCSRKLARAKFNVHRQVKLRSFKKYSKERFEEALTTADFRNYEVFSDMDEALSDFLNKLMLNKVAPI